MHSSVSRHDERRRRRRRLPFRLEGSRVASLLILVLVSVSFAWICERRICIYMCTCSPVERIRRLVELGNSLLCLGVADSSFLNRGGRRGDRGDGRSLPACLLACLCMLYNLSLPQGSTAGRIWSRPTTIRDHGIIEGAPQACSRRRPARCCGEGEREEKRMASTATGQEDASRQRLVLVGLTGSIGRRRERPVFMYVCVRAHA